MFINIFTEFRDIDSVTAWEGNIEYFWNIFGNISVALSMSKMSQMTDWAARGSGDTESGLSTPTQIF